MKLLLVLLLCLPAITALADQTVVAVDNSTVWFSCLSFERATTEWLSFGGAAPYLQKTVIVFDKAVCPTEIGAVDLVLIADDDWQAAKLFQVSAYCSDSATVGAGEWEDKLENHIFVGHFEIPAAYDPAPVLINVTDAMRRLANEAGRYVHFKIAPEQLLCTSRSCSGSFAALENPFGLPGPRLQFSDAVSATQTTIGGVKSLFR